MKLKKLKGQQSQCMACMEVFRSTYAFDQHRKGDYRARRCLSVEEMTALAFTKNAQGFWMSPKSARGSLPQWRNAGDRLEAGTP